MPDWEMAANTRAAPAGGGAGRIIAMLLCLGALLLVCGFFHWTVKSSGGFGAPGDEDYYNFLVRGWRSGQLHMSKEPSPEMLALADPYDPTQNSTARLAHASYFKGRYYLYFGATPAVLVMLPYGLLTGRELGTTTTLFVFCVIGFVTASLLWLKVRHDYFPGSTRWIGPAGVLVLGFGTHVLALQRRPLVWELPIATAYAFSMLALAALYRLIHRPSSGAALFAGLSLGLAAASRPTYLMGAIALVPVAWEWWRKRRNAPTRAMAHLGWMGGGLLVCCAAVAAHNFARFENPLEFG